MSDLAVERGEIDMPPERVVRGEKDTNPTELRYAGKVVVLQNSSVWVDRRYAGVLVAIREEREEIQEAGGAVHHEHLWTTVQWFRKIPGGKNED